MNNPVKRSLFLCFFIFIFSLIGCQTVKDEPAPLPYALKQESDQFAYPKSYRSLEDVLIVYQRAATSSWPTLPAGKLALGVKSNRVPILRDQLSRINYLSSDLNNELFDTSLQQAVKSFQVDHGLNPTGSVDSLTRNELNISPLTRIQQIQINITRWNNLKNKMGDRYILVNVPDYNMTVVNNGQDVLKMKTIVGRTERPTPEIFSKVTRLVLNPYWNVPKKIAKQDILPKIKEDPYYLENMNMKVYREPSRTTPPLDDEEIDWENVENQQLEFHFRQDPGENNSLGIMKFEFANSYDIYMHDTPAKELFNLSNRNLSSGCIRIEKPMELVNYLFKNQSEWSSEKINTIIQSREPTIISIKPSIPIIITYLTVWVDNGKVNFRRDIYNRDHV